VTGGKLRGGGGQLDFKKDQLMLIAIGFIQKMFVVGPGAKDSNFHIFVSLDGVARFC
jgi:hypothetical protein